MNLIRRLLMPDCNRVRKVLQAYLDGELDDRHAATVAAHLEDCDRCGIEADVYEQIKERLSTLHRRPDPAAIDRLRRFAGQVPTTPPEEFRA